MWRVLASVDAGLWGLGPATASAWLGRAAVLREQNCWDVGMGSVGGVRSEAAGV